MVKVKTEDKSFFFFEALIKAMVTTSSPRWNLKKEKNGKRGKAWNARLRWIRQMQNRAEASCCCLGLKTEGLQIRDRVSGKGGTCTLSKDDNRWSRDPTPLESWPCQQKKALSFKALCDSHGIGINLNKTF